MVFPVSSRRFSVSSREPLTGMTVLRRSPDTRGWHATSVMKEACGGTVTMASGIVLTVQRRALPCRARARHRALAVRCRSGDMAQGCVHGGRFRSVVPGAEIVLEVPEVAPALRDEPHRDVHRTLRLEEGDDALLSQRGLPLGDNLLVQAQVRVFLVQVIHVELLEQALPELLGIDLGLQPCSE